MNLKPSDLPLLVSLDVLLEERNVTRAASKLHVSQPALSAQLVRLRRLFNDPLLVPSETGRGMVPTPKAEEMAAALRCALSQLGALSEPDEGFDPSCNGSTFRVAGSFSAIGTFARPLTRLFQAQRNRNLRLAFRIGSDPVEFLAQFEAGEIDVLLVPVEEVPASLKMRQLMSDKFVMLQRAGHPRGTTNPTVEEYCQLGHAVVSATGRLDGLMDGYLRSLGHSRDVLVSVPHGDMMGSVLQTTDLVCTVPQSMADSLGPRVDAFDVPFALPDMSLAMAWHSSVDKQPAHRWLRQELVEVSQNLAPSRRGLPDALPFPLVRPLYSGFGHAPPHIAH